MPRSPSGLFCRVEGCDEPSRYAIERLCNPHYQRQRVWGCPTCQPPPRPSVYQRFFSKVDFNGPPAKNNQELGRCWMWLGSKTHEGYGRFKGTDTSHPHKWAYLRFVGEVPQGRQLDHFACDNSSCVNPWHMRPVTARENALRSDNLCAWELAKTHCPQGHPYSGSNLRFNPNGSRYCLACHRKQGRENARKYRAAKRRTSSAA